MKTKKTLTSLDEFVDKHYGKRGEPARESFEEGYELFKVGHVLLSARKAKGLTQGQLADRAGTTKSYISKIENDVKEARLSTLQKIVELGLGGKLELTIHL